MNKAEKVRKLVLACLNGKEDGAIVVKGIVRNFGFSPKKITEHKEEIKTLLNEMPDEFHAGKGGGMSFLNLCLDKEGNQWAEHPTMEELVPLGEAAGMARFTLPRDMWDVLPGGMPYVTFDTRTSA